MADVRRKQKLVFGFALVQILAVGQVSVREARIDHDLVGLVAAALSSCAVSHAESPILLHNTRCDTG